MQKKGGQNDEVFQKALISRMKSALKNILHSSDDFGFVKVWKTLKVKALKKNCCINRGYGSLVYVNQGFLFRLFMILFNSIYCHNV